jgi:hypothetical protein
MAVAMAHLSDGAAQLAALSKRLKDAGETGLRRNLQQAIDGAVQPLQREIGGVSHLEAYLPDRYAAVLASDLSVTVSRLTGRNPGVRVTAKGRVKERKVQLFDVGAINHPVYARGPRDTWRWSNGQRAGMKAGFFTDPAEKAGPQVRDAITAAMHDTAAKISGG